jgi:hypothetical protein
MSGGKYKGKVNLIENLLGKSHVKDKEGNGRKRRWRLVR